MPKGLRENLCFNDRRARRRQVNVKICMKAHTGPGGAREKVWAWHESEDGKASVIRHQQCCMTDQSWGGGRGKPESRTRACEIGTISRPHCKAERQRGRPDSALRRTTGGHGGWVGGSGGPGLQFLFVCLILMNFIVLQSGLQENCRKYREVPPCPLHTDSSVINSCVRVVHSLQ